MDCHHVIPKLIVHVVESFVSQNSSVVDENINSTEGINGGFDDDISVFSGCLVSYGSTAQFFNFLDGCFWVHEIIDHDGRTKLGEEKGVRATKPARSAQFKKNRDSDNIPSSSPSD